MEIIDVMEKYGFKRIARSGDNYIASCLFHKDNQPSFGIHARTGAWQCFSCKVAGPHIVSLVAKLEGCTDEEATKKLYGGEESEVHYQRLAKHLRKFGVKSAPSEIVENPVIPMDMKLQPWRSGGKDVDAYLERARIMDKTADHFNLAWVPSGYYRGYLAVPVTNVDGTIYTYEFRRVSGPGINGKKVVYPLHSKLSRIIYNLHQLPRGVKKCLIVEGAKDVWTMHQMDVFTVSCFGTHISIRQIQLLLAAGLEEIDLLFDGDEAGMEAAVKMRKLLSEWFSVRVFDCPKDKDPNDLVFGELKEIVGKMGQRSVLAFT